MHRILSSLPAGTEAGLRCFSCMRHESFPGRAAVRHRPASGWTLQQSEGVWAMVCLHGLLDEKRTTVTHSSGWSVTYTCILFVHISFSLSFFKFYSLFLNIFLILRCPLGKVQPQQEQRYPFLSMRAVFFCVQTMVWLPVLGDFNMHTHVNARAYACKHAHTKHTSRRIH